MNIEKLPIGIQNFADIRNKSYYYVDKTAYLIKLVTQHKFIFLSRPRRFGKSLTLDTIAELFLANHSLFTGLYAENNWDWSQDYPVIRLSFGGDNTFNELYLEKMIEERLSHIEQLFHISPNSLTNGDRLQNIIREIHLTTGKKVVILIDEYDKPILDMLNAHEEAFKVRNRLRGLYGAIKESDAHIRFAMLTGVSKFSKVSLFSGVNNLVDITLNENYSALCGYTQEELETVFVSELTDIDLNKLKSWYNGYNWTGQSVYNPFDVLLFLLNRRYEAHWFGSATPTFLMDTLFNNQFDITQIQNSLADSLLLSHFDVGDISPIALMFQTGYLTIDKILDLPYGTRYTLKFPNLEVQQSLSEAIVHKYFLIQPQAVAKIQSQLYQSLVNDNIEAMFKVIQSFFASIPHDWHRNNNIAHFEGYWATGFYAYFSSIGLTINVEEATSNGRMDMTVLFENRVYIFEFKVIRNNQEDTSQALSQIEQKKYADKYKGLNKTIYEIGVNFNEILREVNFQYQLS